MGKSCLSSVIHSATSTPVRRFRHALVIALPELDFFLQFELAESAPKRLTSSLETFDSKMAPAIGKWQQ
jgi:hypothetical protein